MRTIQYFLLGLLMSLCSIPAFSLNCPAPLSEQLVYGWPTCTLGNNNMSVSVFSGSALADLLISKTTGDLPANSYMVNLSMYPDLIEVYFTDIDGNILLGSGGAPLGYTSVEGLSISERDSLWDSFLAGNFISLLSSASSPHALFDIAGIKDNIFSTVLVIITGLLALVIIKYAWGTAIKMISSGGSSSSSHTHDVTYERVGQSSFYRQTEYVDGVDVRHSYGKGGLEGSSYNVGDTGHRGGYDYDEETGKPL